MRFEVKHRIQGSVDEVERAMLDPRYGEFLLKHHGVLLEVQRMEIKAAGDKVHRKVRYRPKPVIASIGPKPVIASVGPKPVPPEWFAFVESSTYDKRRKELKFTNTPTSDKISRMLVNTGTIRLRDAGAGQTERVTEGEISLKLPFLLKPVAMIGERVIQVEGLKILDGEVPVLNRFISEVLRK